MHHLDRSGVTNALGYAYRSRGDGGVGVTISGPPQWRTSQEQVRAQCRRVFAMTIGLLLIGQGSMPK